MIMEPQERGGGRGRTGIGAGGGRTDGAARQQLTIFAETGRRKQTSTAGGSANTKEGMNDGSMSMIDGRRDTLATAAAVEL